MTIEKYGNNRERFINDVMNLMVPIEGGIVELRDYINMNKWLSSNYTLSNPGRESDRKVITWTETIEPFYVNEVSGNTPAVSFCRAL